MHPSASRPTGAPADRASALCHGCRVASECVADGEALAALGYDGGIRGGLTARERLQRRFPPSVPLTGPADAALRAV